MAVNKINCIRVSLIAMLFYQIAAESPLERLLARVNTLEYETQLMLIPLSSQFIRYQVNELNDMSLEEFLEEVVPALQKVSQIRKISAVELFGARLEKLATVCAEMLNKFASLSQEDVKLLGWTGTRRVCQTMSIGDRLVNKWVLESKPRKNIWKNLGLGSCSSSH